MMQWHQWAYLAPIHEINNDYENWSSLLDQRGFENDGVMEGGKPEVSQLIHLRCGDALVL